MSLLYGIDERARVVDGLMSFCDVSFRFGGMPIPTNRAISATHPRGGGRASAGVLASLHNVNYTNRHFNLLTALTGWIISATLCKALSGIELRECRRKAENVWHVVTAGVWSVPAMSNENGIAYLQCTNGAGCMRDLRESSSAR